jgi:putative ABC transport system substrate-binding protein
VKRREFITLLGGAAAAWPLAARAQGERVRRIVVLMTGDDAEGQARMTAFVRGLQQLGWVDGSNVRIEARWTAGKAENVRRHVAELAALAPDVIMATGSAIVGPLLQSIRAVPIVFAQVPIPSAPASSRVWLGPAATPPVSSRSSMVLVQNGWS